MALGTATTVLGTGAVVAIGQWADDKKISVKFVVGLGVFAFSLAVLGEVNPKLSGQFGTLVFVTAILVYGPKAAASLGLIDKTKYGSGILGGLGDSIGKVVSGVTGQ